MEVTIEIERAKVGDVFQWCFDNLSRPAYLLSWERYNGKNCVRCPSVWRRWTRRLQDASYGSTFRTPEGKHMAYVTMGFRSHEDATLFAVKWGSVPFEKNHILHELEMRKLL